MSDYRSVIKEALRAYLSEFGRDGYDEETFVDCVVTELDLARKEKGFGAKQLASFYRRRAREVLGQ
jgi:hypothetical protein